MTKRQMITMFVVAIVGWASSLYLTTGGNAKDIAVNSTEIKNIKTYNKEIHSDIKTIQADIKTILRTMK